MGPFLEGKQGIILRIELVSRTVFTLSLCVFVVDHLLRRRGAKAGVSCVSGLTASPDQSCVYELSAVLIHRGISAYSGHYIAHVKDAHTGDWYKFNDEEIEKMEGKKLQLGIEEDIGKSREYPHLRFSVGLLVHHLPTSVCPEMLVVTMTMLRTSTASSVLFFVHFFPSLLLSWDCEISDQKTKVH